MTASTCTGNCDPKAHCGDYGGRSRQRATPCTLPAGWGTDHNGYGQCRKHLGNAPGQRRQAHRAMAEEAVATYGLPVATTPEQALLDEVHRTAGHVAWLREKVAELDPDALVWGRTKEEDIQASEFAGVNTTDAAAVHMWLELYLRERKHLVDVSAKTIAAGVAERQVRLAERHGELVGELLRAAIDAAGLTDEQEARAYDAVSRRLSAVA